MVSFHSAGSTVQSQNKRPRTGRVPSSLPPSDWQSLPIVSGLMNFFRKIRTDKRRSSVRSPLGYGMRRLTSEPLEQRQLLSLSSVWVNDNWVVTNDVAPVGLSYGDTVDNSGYNDSGDIGGKYFGIDAFSSVGAALPNVDLGGTINVLTGMYNNPAKTVIDKSVHLIGQEYTSGSNTYNAVMAGPDGDFNITGAEVEIDHFIFRDASAGNGAAIEANAASYNVHNNTFTQNSVGLLANAPGTVANNLLYGNNRAGTYRSQGIHVATGATDVVTITGNTFQNHNSALAASPGAIAVESGTASIAGNIFSSTNKNLTDVRLDGANGNLTVGAGNQFSATNYFIENRSPNAVNLVGTSSTFDAADNFRIEDKMFHRVDQGNTAAGLVTWIANQVYVTKPEVGSSDSSIQRGIDAASAGYTVNVEAGAYDESPVVNKSLTLKGEGRDVTTIKLLSTDTPGTPYLASLALTGADSNITIDGFTVEGRNAVGGGLANSNIYLDTSLGTVILRNNRLKVGMYGLGTNYDDGFGIITTYTETPAAFVEDLQVTGTDIVPVDGNLAGRPFAINSGVDKFLFDNNTISGDFASVAFTSALDGTISNNIYTGTDTLPGSRSGGIVTFGYPDQSYGKTAFTNNQISNTRAGIGVYGSNAATVSGNTITGTDRGFFLSNVYEIAGFDPATLSLTGNTFTGNLYDIAYLDANNPSGEFSIVGNTFDGVVLNSATSLEDLFAISDKVLDKIDASGNGLVRLRSGNIYVTPNSFFAPTTTAPSIQRGIDAATAGNTVNVEAGTYTEQVSIGKNLTLKGVGNSTIVKSPTSLATQYDSVKPIVYAHDANVTIEQLKIDGDGQGSANNAFVGLALRNAAGTVDHVTIVGVHDTPVYTGGQHGTALLASNTDGASRTLDITHNVVNDFQKGGIVAKGAGLTANVTGNTVTGYGDTTTIAQNGIQISSSAVGHLVGNTVSGFEYSGTGDPGGPDWLTQTQSCGILLMSTGAGNTVNSGALGTDPNIVDGNDIGIAIVGGQATVSGNILGSTAANRYYGILADGSPAVIDHNTVTGGNVGVALYFVSVGNAVVQQNQIHTGTGIGVEAYQAVVKIEANDLTGNKVGIQAESNATVDAGGGSPGSVGHNVLTGYTGLSGNYAIKNLNTVAVGNKDVYAKDNNFGYFTPPGIEGVIYDDTDNAANTEVIFSQYPPVPTPTVVYVDDDWAGTAYGVNVGTGTAFGYDQFSTIQDAIDAVAVGGTVNVYAGNYAENLAIDKALSLLGPNAAIDPNTETRAAEAVLYPATSDPDPSSATCVNMIYVSVSDVTIKGLTIDGDNPTLTSGVVYNGADIDAIEGIAGYEGVGGIVVENNVIRNLTYSGIDFYNYTNSAATSGNYIRYNKIDNLGGGGYGWGLGVLLYNNFYAVVSNNVITRARVGVQTGNFSQANPGVAASISDNEITATRLGIFYNLHYSNASPFTIEGNEIGAVADLSAPANARWHGILVSTQSSSVNAAILDNIIDGSASNLLTTSGYGVWNTSTTADLTISGGSVSGVDYGVWVNNYEGYNSNANNTHITVSGMNIAAEQIGVYVFDSPSNTNGSTVTATITGSDITTTAPTGVGVKVEGADASATVTENDIFGNAVGVSIVGDADGTVTGNTFSDNSSKQFEGDATTLGLTAGILTGNSFDRAVTVSTAGTIGTISVPAIFSTIQGGINAASAGNTVKAEAGMYDEDVLVDRSVSLLGSGAGSTTIRGVIGGDSATVRVAASNAEIAGFTITRQGNNLTDWNNSGLNSAGIAIQGMASTGTIIHDNVITGNRTGIDINNSSGHAIRNNIIADNRTGMILRNQTDNLTVVENEIADNWTVGVLFLDGSLGTNSPVQSAANCTFFSNDISGNWYGQVVDRQLGGALPAPGTNLKNFSGNWFGTASPVVSTAGSAEPGYAAQIPVAFGGTAVPPGGQPDILGEASANIDYTPWLLSPTDTDTGTMGFQGDFSQVKADDDSPQTGAAGRIAEAIGMVNLHGTVHVAAGTYAEQVSIAREVTVQGAGIDQTIVDVTGMPAANNDSGISITADNVTLAGLTLNEAGVGTGPRYGVYIIGTTGVTVEDVKVTGMKRTGVNVNGAQNLVLDGVQSLNNGGAGIFMADVKGAVLNDITTAGNPWTGVSIATKGQYYPLGTNGIVFSGINSFGESGGDNGGLQLEGYDYATNSSYPITWSTLLGDNADVTILSSDFGYAMSGPSFVGTAEHYTRFYQTLPQAQSAAAGNPDHIDTHDRFIRTTNAFAAPTNYYVFDVAGEKMSIQAAINDAKAGDTVNVASGSFVENVVVNKDLTVVGAGDAASDTVISATATTSIGVDITGSGVTLRDLRVTGGLDGIRVTGGSLSNIALENVTSIGNTGNGFQVSGSASGLTLTDVDLVDNLVGGFRMGTMASVTDMTVTRGHFDRNLLFGVHIYAAPGITNSETQFDNITFTDTTFSDNKQKGFYTEKLNDALFDGVTANNNGSDTAYAWGAGFDINLKYGTFSNITVLKATMTGNATGSANGVGLTVKARGTGSDSGYASNPATLTNVHVTGGDFTGNKVGIRVGEPGKANLGPTGLTIDCVTATGNLNAGISVVGGQVAIQNSDLTGNLIGLLVDGNAVVDAGGGSLASLGKNTLTGYTGVGGNYAIQDLNLVPGNNVLARNNNFGPYADIFIIENYVFDDTDDATRTMIDFSGAQNLTPAAAVVYVDDSWVGLPLGTDPDGVGTGLDIHMGVDAFATIQDGIDGVQSAGKVNVLAGTYAENVVVNKSVEIAGAGQGSVTVYPSFTGANTGGGSLAAGSSSDFLVQANNVTIHDLTVNGDNPSLPGGIDARNGIITNHNEGVYDNLSVHDVTVKNIYLRGIYASSGGTFNFTNNTVDNVQGDAQSVAIMNFGGSGVIQGNTVTNASDAIAANWSTGTQFLGNIVSNSGSGVHTDNSSGGDLIDGNTVSNGTAGSYGIMVFAPYGAITVQNNTITNVDVALTAAGNYGGTSNFLANTVDAQHRTGSIGAYVTTSLFGWGDADVVATLSNNVIKNAAKGAYIEETGTEGNTATATFFDNSFSGNALNINNAGDTLVNASGNWWGASTAAAVADTMSARVDYTPWLNSGTDVGANPADGFQGEFSSLSVDDNNPQTGALGRIQEAVDLVDTATGGAISVYAGDYAEGSLRDWHTGAAGGTSVGLIVYKNNLTIQGVNASGIPITNRFDLPTITATMRDVSLADHIVSGDNVVLSGLKFQGVLDLGGVGPNKTVMDIGDDFTLSNSIIDNTDLGWSALYISNEWATPRVESFHILNNEISYGEITVTNGAGQSDPTNMALRIIQGNCIHDVADWAGVSLMGKTGSGWTPQSIGAVTISYNDFENNAHQIMARGADYENPTGYWMDLLLNNHNTFDKAAVALTPTGDARVSSIERLDYVTGGNLRLIGTSIQEGVDRAAAGDTVKVLAGTYDENVVVDRQITLDGAGSGAAGTVINAGGGIGLNITAGGSDATHRLVISDLRVTGGSNGIYTDSTVGCVTLSNVVSTANASYGLEIHNNAVVTDLALDAVTLSSNQVGFRVASSGAVNGLTVSNSHFDNNQYGLYNEMNPAKSDNQTDFQNILITNSSFDNNAARGIYVEKLHNATFDGVQVIDSGAAGTNAIDINLKQGAYSGVVFTNLNIDGNNTARGLAVKARNDGGYAAIPASLTGVTLNTVSITDSTTNLYLDNNVGGVSFADVQLLGMGVGLSFYASAPQTLDIGNTTFAGTLTAYIGNGSVNPIDATGATFGGILATAATNAQQFAIVDKIVDGVDIGGLGLVRTRANEVFVTPNSFFAPYTTAPSIQRGIDAATAGDTVTVAAGAYYGQVNIAKPLILRSASGAANTFIQGNGAALANAGQVRITAAGDVAVNGFTVRNADAESSSSHVRVGIDVSSASASATYTIADNVIRGTGNAADDQDYGFYAHGGSEHTVFSGNTVTATGANAVLIERHAGAVDIIGNTLDAGAYGTDAVFIMTYGGQDIISLQNISGNAIDLGTGEAFDSGHKTFGVTFASAFLGLDDSGTFTDVHINSNVISNLKSYCRGIGLWNNAGGDGSAGDISNAEIGNNTITGVGADAGSLGIRLLGLHTGANIHNNLIENVATGFLGQAWNGHVAPTADVVDNKFAGFTPAQIAVNWAGTGELNAIRNYWGTDFGPTTPLNTSALTPKGGTVVGANVVITPWRTDGTDTLPAVAGFQPNDNVDSTAPAVSPADLTTDSGVSDTDNITNDNTPTFAGTAEVGATVAIMEDATVLGTIIATDGTWSITSTLLADGIHNISVRATDQAGNATVSSPLAVTIDSTNPTIDMPADRTVIEGDMVTLTATPNGTGSDIAGRLWHLVTATNGQMIADSSTESITFTAIDNGIYTFNYTATDLAGNSTTRTVIITAENFPVDDWGTALTVDINENDLASLNGWLHDPGVLDTHKVLINWGDGSAIEEIPLAVGVLDFATSHRYLDNGNFLVTYDIADNDDAKISDFGFGLSEAGTVVVTNVIPVVTAVNLSQTTIDENGDVTVTGSLTDVGTLDTHTVQIVWGDGQSSPATVTQGVGGATFTATHRYLDDNPTGTLSDSYTISVTATDDDGGVSAAATQTITVTNVIPVVTAVNLSQTTIDENGDVTVTGSLTDVGTLDTHTVQIVWGDGQSSPATVTQGVGGATFTATHRYLDDNPTGTLSDSYTISVTATDDDGGVSAAATQTITVTNVIPVVTAVNLSQTTIDENGDVTVTGSLTDVGTLDTHTVQIVWGDGQSSPATVTQGVGGATFTATHRYLDDNPTGTLNDSYTISVTATDDDGGVSAAATQTITVTNVIPVVTAVNLSQTTSDENGDVTVTGSLTDVGTLDTHTVQIVWGDGQSSPATVTQGVGGATFTATHRYLDDNPTGTLNDSYTISVTATDDDGGVSAAATQTITVTNVIPVVTAVNLSQTTIDENGDVTVTGSLTDVGTLDTHTVQIVWGDGQSSPATVTQGVGGATFTATHRYLDDNPTGTLSDSYTISVTATDDDGGVSAAATQTITVTNVIPVVTAVNLSQTTIDENGDVTVTGSLTDVGTLDTHTVQIVWGDGQSSPATVTQGVGGATFTATHRYLDDNPTGTLSDSYTISVTATDDDGGVSAAATQTITVTNVIPVVTAVNLSQTTIDENGDVTVTGSLTDVGTLDTHTVQIVWGDGQSSPATVTQGVGGATFTATHRYLDDNPSDSYTISVTATDDDGVSTAATQTIAVYNVAPTAALNNSGPVNEGSSGTVVFSSQYDPSPVDISAGLRYAFDFNNDGDFTDPGDIGLDGSFANSTTSATATIRRVISSMGRAVSRFTAESSIRMADYMTTLRWWPSLMSRRSLLCTAIRRSMKGPPTL